MCGYGSESSVIRAQAADSDEAGHLFQYEAGHLFDFIPAVVPI